MVANYTKINMNQLLSLFLIAFLALSNSSLPIISAATPTLASQCNISAVFAFGDSTLDPGNNNGLSTLVKADHAPYGQNFPSIMPTGRFSNGNLVTDFLVNSLGLKEFLPPFTNAQMMTSADVLTGVSFASAGSGLYNLTAIMSGTIPIETQVENFHEYVRIMMGSAGKEGTYQIVKDALIIIGAGSNDMIMNYYLNLFTRLQFTSVDRYHDFLLERMTDLVQELHAMGGRKFAIAGLPPLGCIPLVISFADIVQGLPQKDVLTHRSCVVQANLDARAYNAKLDIMVRSMQYSLPGTKFAYVDVFHPLMDMITYPNKYGFGETGLGCCGSGAMEMGPTCGFPSTKTCEDSSKYLFWDSVHPSHVAYQALSYHMMRTVLKKLAN